MRQEKACDTISPFYFFKGMGNAAVGRRTDLAHGTEVGELNTFSHVIFLMQITPP